MSRTVRPACTQIVNRRRRKGWSQERLIEEIERRARGEAITLRTLQYMESGKQCYLGSLRWVATALECSVEELLSPEEREPCSDREILPNQETPVSARLSVRPLRSIAVLPFVDETSEADQAHLSDGLAEQVIDALVRISELSVCGRASSFVFRDPARTVEDIHVIGKRLGVEGLLCATVGKELGTAQVTARLIVVDNAQVLWTEVYEAEESSFAGLPERIANSVARVLQTAGPSQHSSQVLFQPRHPEAFEFYLRGRYQWNTRTIAGLQLSVKCFNAAIAKDPYYALAYSGLADSYYSFAEYGAVAPHVVMPKAKAAALRAIELDSKLSSAHASLGLVLAAYDYRWEQAHRAFERAIELNPGYADVHHLYGMFLAWMDSFDRATVEMHKAQRLDPLNVNINRAFGTLAVYARRPEQALIEYERLIVMMPDFFGWHLGAAEAYLQMARYDQALNSLKQGHALSGDLPLMKGMMGYCYGCLGQRANAISIYEQLKSQGQTQYVPAAATLLPWLGLGDLDKSFRELERVYQERSPLLVWARVDYKVDTLRKDARFLELLRRMNV